MPVFVPDLVLSVEAHRARSKPAELPRCDGLRLCAAAIFLGQVAQMNRGATSFELGLSVQVGFAITGFLLVRYLLGEIKPADSGNPLDTADWVVTFLRTLPIGSVAAAVAVVLYLPGILSLKSVSVPDPNDLPALIVRWLESSLADFLRSSPHGRSLIAWPIVVLLAPRRMLGVTFLAFLGSGLTVQFSDLFAGNFRPASILVVPSPLDLMAAGALASAIWQGLAGRGNGPMARWALLMSMALMAASIGSWKATGSTHWGSSDLVHGPIGFGAANFILKIMATTLVASAAWRDSHR